jgi:hypothetical protein
VCTDLPPSPFFSPSSFPAACVYLQGVDNLTVVFVGRGAVAEIR